MRKKTVIDEIGAGTFMHMKENMTTISHKNQELQNEVIRKLQDIVHILMADMPVNTKEWKIEMKKEEMENDNVVTCHEEGMSWKTMIPWQAKWQKQKESTEEPVLPPLHKIHTNEYNYTKDSTWKDKRWKWD